MRGEEKEKRKRGEKGGEGASQKGRILQEKIRKLPFPEVFLTGRGVIHSIREDLEEEGFYFENPVVATGPGFTKRFGELFYHHFVVEHASWEEVKRFRRFIEKNRNDLIVGVGGGRVLDVSKLAGGETGIPFLSVPTTLSNDGIYSPVAVISFEDGIKSVQTELPLGIVIDVEVIKSAPGIYLLAGVGDLIANMSALKDWELAESEGREKLERIAYLISRDAVESFVEFASNGYDVHSPIFIERLSDGLLASGISMAIAGTSRPASGSEHLISHALDKILEKPLPHGIQTGMATLFTECLRGEDISLLKKTMEKLGFPASPEEVGIKKETFLKAVELGPETRKGRFTILDITGRKEWEEAYKKAFE
ncbi:glycerol-1-phosphate dehydrogenase [bacterium]|nr:MAG: glycerol-1-phosphate dehydrogenase [bacterium]